MHESITTFILSLINWFVFFKFIFQKEKKTVASKHNRNFIVQTLLKWSVKDFYPHFIKIHSVFMSIKVLSLTHRGHYYIVQVITTKRKSDLIIELGRIRPFGNWQHQGVINRQAKWLCKLFWLALARAGHWYRLAPPEFNVANYDVTVTFSPSLTDQWSSLAPGGLGWKL